MHTLFRTTTSISLPCLGPDKGQNSRRLVLEPFIGNSANSRQSHCFCITGVLTEISLTKSYQPYRQYPVYNQDRLARNYIPYLGKSRAKLYCCFFIFKKRLIRYVIMVFYINFLTTKQVASFIISSPTYFQDKKCAIKNGNKRTDYFNYNKGVPQGCIISSLLSNLYLDDIARILVSQIAPNCTKGEIHQEIQ